MAWRPPVLCTSADLSSRSTDHLINWQTLTKLTQKPPLLILMWRSPFRKPWNMQCGVTPAGTPRLPRLMLSIPNAGRDMQWGATEATPFSGTHDAFQNSLRKYPVSILRHWGIRGIVFDTCHSYTLNSSNTGLRGMELYFQWFGVLIDQGRRKGKNN